MKENKPKYRNSTDYAFSRPYSYEGDAIAGFDHDAIAGLTKREYFAVHLMAGSLASDPSGKLSPQQHAGYAISCVHALIGEFEK